MPFFMSLRRPAIFAAVLLPLLASARTSAVARGQNGKPIAAAQTSPLATTAAASTSPPIAGTGEQMRALAAVSEMWEARRLSEAKKSGRKVDPNAAQDSLDIRGYNFSVAQEKDVFKVTLRNPAVLKAVTPQGTQWMPNSSTFFYDVRRSDFKIVGMSAIL